MYINVFIFIFFYVSLSALFGVSFVSAGGWGSLITKATQLDLLACSIDSMAAHSCAQLSCNCSFAAILYHCFFFDLRKKKKKKKKKKRCSTITFASSEALFSGVGYRCLLCRSWWMNNLTRRWNTADLPTEFRSSRNIKAAAPILKSSERIYAPIQHWRTNDTDSDTVNSNDAMRWVSMP